MCELKPELLPGWLAGLGVTCCDAFADLCQTAVPTSISAARNGTAVAEERTHTRPLSSFLLGINKRLISA